MKWSLVASLGLVGCLGQLPRPSEPCGEWPDPGLFRLDVEIDGEVRDPYVYVPRSTGPRDVLYLLHGANSGGPSFAETTEYRRFADERGMVLVYPNGMGWPLRHWNAGPGVGNGGDDIAFLEQLATEVDARVCPRRTFASGFSQGAMMVHRWSCETETLDAIGVSSGNLLVDECTSSPVPTLHFHGLGDPIVPVKGGGRRPGVDSPSVDEAMAIIRKRNNCRDVESVEVFGDTTCTRWACEAPTELCLVKGWGHQWPGGVNAGGTDANASGRILDFFDETVPLEPQGDTGVLD